MWTLDYHLLNQYTQEAGTEGNNSSELLYFIYLLPISIRNLFEEFLSMNYSGSLSRVKSYLKSAKENQF